MAQEILAEQSLNSLLQATTHLIKLPKLRMWLDFDAEVDVLYVHFEEKPKSTHSDMREDGIIFDYAGSRLVGVTILEASRR